MAVGLADVSLTAMIVGACVLAGATVIMAAVPGWRVPWRRHRDDATPPAVVQPVAQRRVVTGPRPTLPTAAESLGPRVVTVPQAAGQALALPDGRRPTTADVMRAEAVIDEFLDADPRILAKVLSSWIAADERDRRHH